MHTDVWVLGVIVLCCVWAPAVILDASILKSGFDFTLLELFSSFSFSKIPLEETVSELRKELEHCLISYKAKQEQVREQETNLGALKVQLRDQEMKAQRMEQIAQELEVEFYLLV